jgi:hypothetical protein
MISLGAIELQMTNPQEISTVENAIHLVRGLRVMLDSDLARIYGVSTMRLNEQLRRNKKRFPSDFAFQLTREEFTNLISQFAISRSEAIAQLFAAIRQLLAPPPEKKREIGFHVRERRPSYRAKGRA